MQLQTNGFTFNRVGTTGFEIRGPNGLVVAWTVNEVWAAVIVQLLNNSPSAAAGTGCVQHGCCETFGD